MSAAPAAPVAVELAAELQRFLNHLRVERRLAERTLAMYREALLRLQLTAAAA
jgi:integrase/recombinase XerC